MHELAEFHKSFVKFRNLDLCKDLCTSRLLSWPVVQDGREVLCPHFPVVVKKGLREHSLC
jgi:hypothetical protein